MIRFIHKAVNRNNHFFFCAFLFIIILNANSQKISKCLKYDLKYSFQKTNSTVNKLILWIPKKTYIDSIHHYKNPNEKITINFKIYSKKAKCDFTLIDSINKFILTGQFLDGISLLRQQVSVVSSTGDEIMTIENFYEGIPNGKWVYRRFDNTIISEELFNIKTK